MGVLRERLRDSCPTLADALDRSWTIAREEWLPALGVALGSFNSYPHLRNLENYCDQVVEGFEIHPAARTRVELSPVEIYLLLSAVLFHDIGRITFPKDHGVGSYRLIKAERAALGIPSQLFAETLARICMYHEPPTVENWNARFSLNPLKKPQPGDAIVSHATMATELRDTIIDPFGQVREALIAGLLTLVDHLDSAATRVLPTYLRGRTPPQAVGAFRGLIHGVAVEADLRMVRTVLSDYSCDAFSSDAIIMSWQAGKREYKKTQTEVNNLITQKSPRLQIKKFDKVLREDRTKCVIFDRSLPEGVDVMPSDWLVMAGKMRANLKEGSESNWPPSTILSIVLSDIGANNEAIREIRDQLARAGMPLLAWVIDFRGHLYTATGDETFEPIFTFDYLCRTLEAMWQLSRRIIGISDLRYETLAAELREPNVNRVRTAVRRLAILTEFINDEPGTRAPANSPPAPIWCGQETWRWMSECPKDCVHCIEGAATRRCRCHSYSNVREYLSRIRLCEPISGNSVTG